MPNYIRSFGITSYLVTNVGGNCSREKENISAGHKDPYIIRYVPRKHCNSDVRLMV